MGIELRWLSSGVKYPCPRCWTGRVFEFGIMSGIDPQQTTRDPARTAGSVKNPQSDDGTTLKPPSLIGRLLAEISWDGNARTYRDGGRGRENVLTTEVFQALDFLPRTRFLGRVIRSAEGAEETRRMIVSQIDEAVIELLPGDLVVSGKGAGSEPLSVQPDGIIQTPDVYCLLEAKRIRRGAFQPHQLAREYLTVLREAGDRHPLLLLVLPEAPPVLVRGHGRLSIQEAIARWVTPILPQLDAEFPSAEELVKGIESAVAWVTWSTISEDVAAGLEHLNCPDASFFGSISRLVQSVRQAIEWHS